MTLLDFARGPAMQWAFVIFGIGVAWRLVGMFLLLRDRAKARARRDAPVSDGTRAIIMRSVPPKELEHHIVFQHVSGYAWHIGFFVTILFFGPHMPFWKSILGFGWPTLPSEVITVVGAITIAVLIALLVRRLSHPVLRVISTADDYISVIVTILPLLTGLISYANIGFDKETNLALHLLSIVLVLVWFPFGKLMHLFLAFPTRYKAGADYGRKGVAA
jgi:nitrate reductase gamma subunit